MPGSIGSPPFSRRPAAQTWRRPKPVSCSTSSRYGGRFSSTRRTGCSTNAFQTRSDAAIAAIEAWTRREPTRAEAWFYLGGAYGARAQWRVLREERLAAARDGKRIKNSLEQALALDPSLRDAYFGIGLYHYYADVAPAALRMLRWLLLLPAGNRVQGLEEMLRARKDGQLLQSEADFQLHLIYLWYEKQPERALQLLRDLRERHPANPLFPQLIANVQDVYVHDLQASRETWQSLLEAARAGRVAEPEMSEAAARLGLAGLLDRLSDSESALPHLRTIVETKPSAPLGIVASAQRADGTHTRSSWSARRGADGLSSRAREHSSGRSRSDRERRESGTARAARAIEMMIDHARCRTYAHLPTLDFVGAVGRASGIATTRSFDKRRDFVLDSKEISPIIYIWYEGGWLSPPVVTAAWSVGG